MLLFLVRCSKTFYTTISNQSINSILNKIPIFANLFFKTKCFLLSKYDPLMYIGYTALLGTKRRCAECDGQKVRSDQ